MSDVQPIDLNDLQRVGVLVRIQLDDNWLADMIEIAAAEIARLREERLTNEERGAISWATAALLHDADKTWPAFRDRSKHSREAAKTLKGLLERQPLPPGPEANG